MIHPRGRVFHRFGFATMSDLDSRTETEANGQILKVSLYREERALSYREVIELWRKHDGFRVSFNASLAEAPFAAYFWETPPVTQDTLEREFEFVLSDAPALAGARADPLPFRNQLRRAGDSGVVVFENLGGDARLISPCLRAGDDAYPHLAAFVRGAPGEQQRQLWQQVGEVIHEEIGARPIWLSTSGMGVFWVHVRVDRTPKYYTYAPYRRFP